MTKLWLAPIAWALAGAASASTCETLRAEIEAKIAAAGVARFTVSVVDAEAPAAGRVVGTCEMGRKKIVYERPDAPAGAAPGEDAILTECRDGSVSMGGSCRN